MRVADELVVEMPPSRAWEALASPQAIQAALPSASEVVEERDGTFLLVLEVDTSLGTTHMELTCQMEDEDVPRHLRFRAHGGRANDTTVQATVDIRLAAVDGGRTRFSWMADVRVSGLLGSVAQRSIPGLVRAELSSLLQGAGQAS